MRFDVVFADRARKDLERLQRDQQMRVLLKLEDTRLDPPHFFRRLKGTTALRMRVRDLRVLADVDATATRIVVLHIAPRDRVYDR